jgi:hypothetical protein
VGHGSFSLLPDRAPEQVDFLDIVGLVVAMEEVVLPDLGFGFAGAGTPAEIGLRLAIDQAPVHAAHPVFLKDRQACIDKGTSSPVEPLRIDDRAGVGFQCGHSRATLRPRRGEDDVAFPDRHASRWHLDPHAYRSERKGAQSLWSVHRLHDVEDQRLDNRVADQLAAVRYIPGGEANADDYHAQAGEV